MAVSSPFLPAYAILTGLFCVLALLAASGGLDALAFACCLLGAIAGVCAVVTVRPRA